MTISFRQAAAGALSAAAVVGGMAGVAEAKTMRGASTIRGTVVHHNRRAHSFVVVDRAGHLYAVHARRAPRIGSRVVVRATRLRDGTYRLQRSHRAGHAARRVRIRGTVSYVDARTGAFTVSAPGVSMLVVRGHQRAAHIASSSSSTPSVGSQVVVTGTVDNQGELEDQSVQTTGTQSTSVDLEGTVLSVDTTAQTITVSADDSEQSGASVTVTIPASFNIAQFTPGEEVELIVTPTGPGTATLLGSADDQNAQTANSSSDQQGVNPGEDGQGDQQSGQSGDAQGSGHGDSSQTGGQGGDGQSSNSGSQTGSSQTGSTGTSGSGGTGGDN